MSTPPRWEPPGSPGTGNGGTGHSAAPRQGQTARLTVVKYVSDATSIVFLALGIVLLAALVKMFLLPGKRKDG